MRNRVASPRTIFVAIIVAVLTCIGLATPASASTDTIVSAAQRTVTAQPAASITVASAAFTTGATLESIAAPAEASVVASAPPVFTEAPAPVPAVDKWVTTGGLNVREAPTSENNQRVDVLAFEAKVNVTGFQLGQDPRGDGRNKWYVITGSNPTRFVWEGGLTDVAPAPKPAPIATPAAPAPAADSAPVATPAPAPAPSGSSVETVVATASRYIGTRYVLGGNDFNGIDCSGLTIAAFREVGIDLPRVSHQQNSWASRNGTHVGGKLDAQRGDLLYWSTGHVAVATGNGMMIDAPKPGGKVSERKIWGNPVAYRIL